MFRKVVTIAALMAAISAEPPIQAHYSPGGAVSSQSFTRHDVSLYKQTSTHPKHVPQTIRNVAAAPINNDYSNYASPAPTTYVSPIVSHYPTPSSQTFKYFTPSSDHFQDSTPPSKPIQYSTPPSEQFQYSTPSPTHLGNHDESEYISRPVQALQTKPVGPSENGQYSEFTQAYFLPSTSSHSGMNQYSGKSPSYTQQIQSSNAVPQQYYLMVAQPQRSTAPIQFQTSIPLQSQIQYQAPSAQPSTIQYVPAPNQYPRQQQQYAYPQYDVAYRVGAESNEQKKPVQTSPLAVDYQEYRGSSNPLSSSKSSNAATAIAKLPPAAFTSAKNFAKPTPIYESAPVYSKSAPSYAGSAPSFTKSSNSVQYTPVYAKPPTQYVVSSPIYEQSSSKFAQTPPSYVKSATQYVEAAPSYRQTTQLYPITNNQQYYANSS